MGWDIAECEDLGFSSSIGGKKKEKVRLWGSFMGVLSGWGWGTLGDLCPKCDL